MLPVDISWQRSPDLGRRAEPWCGCSVCFVGCGLQSTLLVAVDGSCDASCGVRGCGSKARMAGSGGES